MPTFASTLDQMIAQRPDITWSPWSEEITTDAIRATLTKQTRNPRVNIPIVASFCFRGRCRLAIDGMGRTRTAKSRKISIAATDSQ